jgi:multimeric flavodoxin WrbA
MKALILDGFQNVDDSIESISKGIIETLKEHSWEVESIFLKERDITPCQGCFDCWVKNPGSCKTDDDAREIRKKWVQSDLIIHYTPITFGGYSSQLKKLMDRFIPVLLPFFQKIDGEIHHKFRYESRPSIIVIGYLNKPNDAQEKTFRKLVKRNSLNMGAPLHDVIIHSENGDKSDLFNQFKTLISKLEVK